MPAGGAGGASVAGQKLPAFWGNCFHSCKASRRQRQRRRRACSTFSTVAGGGRHGATRAKPDGTRCCSTPCATRLSPASRAAKGVDHPYMVLCSKPGPVWFSLDQQAAWQPGACACWSWRRTICARIGLASNWWHSYRPAPISGRGILACRIIWITLSVWWRDWVAHGLQVTANLLGALRRPSKVDGKTGHRQPIDLALMAALGYLPEVVFPKLMHTLPGTSGQWQLGGLVRERSWQWRILCLS